MTKKLVFLLLIGLSLQFWGCVCTRTIYPKNPKTLDFGSIEKFLEFALAAYESADSIKKVAREFDTVIIESTPKSKGLYFLATNASQKRHLISCRGTANIRNAIVDLNIPPEKSEKAGIALHRGFKEAADEMYTRIRPKLDPTFEVFLTGHSLGGAEAVVLGMYLKNDGYRIGGIYTFGQPKVTDKSGGEKFKDLPLLRAVNKKDVVAIIPPEFCFLYLFEKGYRHFGASVFFLDSTRYCEPEGSCQEFRVEADFWTGLLKQVKSDTSRAGLTAFLKDRVPDHFGESYSNSVKSIKAHPKKIECPGSK